MFIPKAIFEKRKILDFLIKRDLLKQYRKAKLLILEGKGKSVKFKIREPKKDEIWYFRINNQYRALCFFDKDFDLIVFKIDNHQN